MKDRGIVRSAIYKIEKAPEKGHGGFDGYADDSMVAPEFDALVAEMKALLDSDLTRTA